MVGAAEKQFRRALRPRLSEPGNLDFERRQLGWRDSLVAVGRGVVSGEKRRGGHRGGGAGRDAHRQRFGRVRDGRPVSGREAAGYQQHRRPRTLSVRETGQGLYDDGFYELTLLSDRYRGSSHIHYARFAKRTYELAAEPRKSP